MHLFMDPPPGTQRVGYVGDRLRVSLQAPEDDKGRAFLRTNLTRGAKAREEVLALRGLREQDAATFAGASWRDIPMRRKGDHWALDLPLTEVGHFRAKAYLRDGAGRQHWPDGEDLGVSVLPDRLRSGNVLYCAFPRLFGSPPGVPSALQALLPVLDASGWTVIPPSGRLRDLTAALPHIFDDLGCRILHLLPVMPTPTTHARLGRFGSPYAALDLTGIDPALVEHDGHTTAEDQFQELADGVHARGGLLLLDLVAHHTGWGSTLMAEHPEWFRREPDGRFRSPGAWGTVWADLVELEDGHPAYWEVLAEALLVWCGRGVDGFRCDAGYMVPLAAWQAVQARVRQVYPDTVFLLEGLGGAWEATETLLTAGGMQWAYSELFQNFEAAQVAGYLDHALRQALRLGPLMHYSETHDNPRLAARGPRWSLLRNRLCALASVAGTFGYTCGVEWLADEKIDVHERTSLAWGRTPNLVEDLGRLARLLRDHPCFFDGAVIRRLSTDGAQVLALDRTSHEGLDRCLVLVNLDPDGPGTWDVPPEEAAWVEGLKVDLLGQAWPTKETAGGRVMTLPPGGAYCLATDAMPQGISGEAYRERRAQAAWALQQLTAVMGPEELGPCDWRDLAGLAAGDPAAFLGALPRLSPAACRRDLLGALRTALAEDAYPRVVEWTVADLSRERPVPPEHWVLFQDPKPFRLEVRQGAHLWQAASVPMSCGHAAALPPAPWRHPGSAAVTCHRLALPPERLVAPLRFLPADPAAGPYDPKGLVLLTNGRGAMVRLQGDLGSVASKYDCLLGANLHPTVPCDRHVLAKRLRAWVNADGFLTALEATCLERLDPGPPARWCFRANAGDGRTVPLSLTVDMAPLRNELRLRWTREDGRTDPPVSLTLRLDLEDRGFHGETRASPDLDAAWRASLAPLEHQAGFRFQPAPDRGLRAWVDTGLWHPEAEWCRGVAHPLEAERGQWAEGDAWSPGWFELPLERQPVTLAVSTELDGFGPFADPAPAATFEARLITGLRALLATRSPGLTVIAGYPWFLDWGRDSAVAARGLLAGGLAPEAEAVLLALAAEEARGSLPNQLGTGGDRATSDAPLWFALACAEAAAALGPGFYETPTSGGRTVAEVLRSLVRHHLTATASGVRVDPASGLVWSPARHTWMDTGHPACTPREGYPVELQALWIRLLHQAATLTGGEEHAQWMGLADRAGASLDRYWLPDQGWLADVLEAPEGTPAAEARPDPRLRPNQLLAVTLGFVSGLRARQIVAAVGRHLVVPGGLRSLAPLPCDGWPYAGRYEGDEDTRRKPAYHNGTAWVWWLPAYAEAVALAWDHDPSAIAAARAHLADLDRLLHTGCLGFLPELLDGDAPHRPRGCDAQAWSLSEALRVWQKLQAR